MSLNRKRCHFYEIFIIGCAGSCSCRNFPCSQWWKCHQYGDISVSMRRTTVCKGYQSFWHYYDVIMGAMASQITCLTIVYSTVYSDADQRKHQSSASLAFVRGIHRGPVNSPHKWPVTRKMFPFDDVIMIYHSFWERVLNERLYWRSRRSHND